MSGPELVTLLVLGPYLAMLRGYSCFCTLELLLGSAQGTIWDDRIRTWVIHMQGKPPTICTIAPAPSQSLFPCLLPHLFLPSLLLDGGSQWQECPVPLPWHWVPCLELRRGCGLSEAAAPHSHYPIYHTQSQPVWAGPRWKPNQWVGWGCWGRAG